MTMTNDIMTISNTNDKGLRKEGRKMTKGRKEDYQGKERRLPRKGRKIIKGRKRDYQGKQTI